MPRSGFVTGHFDCIEREVELYASLATWETDLARRHAMHKRRMQLLQPPLAELNEKAYAQIVRQVRPPRNLARSPRRRGHVS